MRRRTFLQGIAGLAALGVASRLIDFGGGETVGVRMGRWDGSTDQTRIAHYDNLIAPSGFGRQYLPITSSFSGSYIQRLLANRRCPAISLHAWTEGERHAIPWLEIYRGFYDEMIHTNLVEHQKLDRPVPTYFTFHHEPENDVDGATGGDLPAGEGCGTLEDFKLAAEHFRVLLRGVFPVAEAYFGVTLMQGRYASGSWREWVPPRYGFLGVDGYSHGKLNKHGEFVETFSNIFTPAHNAAVSVGKQLLIQECGVAEVPGTLLKANFFADMRSLAKSWPELIGLIYSNTQAKEDYRADTTPESLAAFQAFATDPYFKGDWT